MADFNAQTDLDDTLTYSDSDNYLIFQDSEDTPLANMADFANDKSENFLFDMESGGININNTTTSSTDGALGASNSDLADGYTSSSDVVNVWGTPSSDSDYWREQNGNTCSIVAQISVYESITGEYISETTAAEYAQEQGWYDPEEGTLREYSGSILNACGIETEQSYDNTIETIAEAMNNGDKVIVSLDANEIWDPIYSTTGEPYEQTDAAHAVWVTGIQQNSDNTIDFVLNDSGTSYGQGDLVDYYDFINAWDDYDNYLTIADA
ncbi:MAG: C39 family peptidase [Waterburya sp.]